jgi:hypothetical protein
MKTIVHEETAKILEAATHAAAGCLKVTTCAAAKLQHVSFFHLHLNNLESRTQ